jgi:hypothetical protein
VARLSATPGEIRHAGRPLGADQALVDAVDPWGDAAPGRDEPGAHPQRG